MTDVANLSGPIEIKITSNISRNTDTNIEKVATALNNLKSSISGVDSVTAQLGKLTTSLRELDGTNLSKATSALNRFQKSIPNFSQAFKNLDFDSLTAGVTKYVAAMTPLATLMSQLAAGFNALPPALKIYTQSLNTTGSATNNFTKSQKTMLDGLRTFRVQALAVIFVANRLAKSFANLVDKANRYIENLNLFTITMGKATNATLAYIETVSQAVGIDPAEWIEHQGVFKQIVSGFGVVEERANLMSQNLTQLVYDTTSFFNTSIESSAQRFEAAMAQQSRPLRRYGYDISMTALREEALALGISKTVDEMTRAEKAQLTYIVLMKQSSNIMGDMARTVTTPENALRVLRMQIDMMGRSLGNVLIPMVQAVLPYLIAFAQAVQVVANSLAAWLGFKMPEIDYSGMDTGPVVHLEDAFDDLGGSIGGATAKAKEFKNFVLGFDELHIIPTPGKAGGGGGGGLDSGLDDLFAGINLPSYDFLEQLAATDGRIAQLRDKIVDFLTTVGSVIKAFGSIIEGVGFALITMLAGKLIRNAVAWFITKFSGLRGESLQTALDRFSDKIIGTALVVGGLGLSFIGTMKTTERYKLGKISSLEYIIAMSGTALASLGMVTTGLQTLGMGLGGSIGVGIGLVVITTALAAWKGHLEAVRKEQKEILNQRFLESAYGDINLTSAEIRKLSDTIRTSDFTFKLDGLSDMSTQLESVNANIIEQANQLETTRFHIQLGFDIPMDELRSDIMALVSSLQEYLKLTSSRIYLIADMVFGEGSEAYTQLTSSYRTWEMDKQHQIQELSNSITETFQGAIEAGLDAIATDELLAPLYDKLDILMDEIQNLEAYKARLESRLEYGFFPDEADLYVDKLSPETYQAFRESERARAEKYIADRSSNIQDLGVLYSIDLFGGAPAPGSLAESVLGQLSIESWLSKEFENLDVFSGLKTKTQAGLQSIYDDELVNEYKNWINALEKEYEGLPDEMVRMNELSLSATGWATGRSSLAQTKEKLKEHTSDIWDEISEDMILLRDNYYQEARKAGLRLGEDEIIAYTQGWEIGEMALDQYAIDFFEGRSLFKNDAALSQLAWAEGYGAQLIENATEGIVDGIYSWSYLYEDAGGEIMFKFFNGADWVMGELTPTLYQNLKDMGYGMTLETENAIIEQLFLSGERREIYDALLGLFKLTPEDISTPRDVLEAIESGVADPMALSLIKEKLAGLFPGVEIGDTFVSDFMVEMTKLLEKSTFISNEIKKKFKIPDQTIRVSQSGSTIYIASRQAQAYATGGYPTAGDLFMANEAGPEFVGLQGRRTVVANNMQIVDGISQGVLEGMLMAATISEGRSDGSGGNLTIQIGDEVIWRKTMDEARREGQRTGSSVVMVR